MLEYWPALLDPLSSRTITHGIPAHRSLKMPKVSWRPGLWSYFFPCFLLEDTWLFPTRQSGLCSLAHNSRIWLIRSAKSVVIQQVQGQAGKSACGSVWLCCLAVILGQTAPGALGRLTMTRQRQGQSQPRPMGQGPVTDNGVRGQAQAGLRGVWAVRPCCKRLPRMGSSPGWGLPTALPGSLTPRSPEGKAALSWTTIKAWCCGPGKGSSQCSYWASCQTSCLVWQLVSSPQKDSKNSNFRNTFFNYKNKWTNKNLWK